MFEKIKNKFNEMIESAEKLNKQNKEKLATHFDDEVAAKTSWSPLKRGGSNFKTHNLIKQSSGILKYQLSGGGLLFLGIFGLIGVGMLLFMVYKILNSSEKINWLLLIIGSTFSLTSFFLYKTLGKPVFLDRSIGIMYKGNNAPKLSGQQNNSELVYFSDVHAIQIIKEYVRSNKSSYHSYEINFVMADASRVNLVDHGSYKQIQKDAQEISEFLGKPVWDAVEISSAFSNGNIF